MLPMDRHDSPLVMKGVNGEFMDSHLTIVRMNVLTIEEFEHWLHVLEGVIKTISGHKAWAADFICYI